MIWAYLLAALGGYLLGSIPFGLVLTRLAGLGDIRKIGSGNIGATNMLRTGKKSVAALTLVLDFFKGAVAIGVAQGLCNHFFSASEGAFTDHSNIIYFAGFIAVAGHIFPIWLRFKGGKGVATTLGVFWAIEPLLGMVTTIGWIFVFYLTRISSLSAIGCIGIAPFLAFRFIGMKLGFMSLAIAVMVIYRHKDNILRLRTGREDKWENKDEPS